MFAITYFLNNIEHLSIVGADDREMALQIFVAKIEGAIIGKCENVKGEVWFIE